MPEDSVDEWIRKAEQDFEYARIGMRRRKNPLYDGVCFHAQQCAEKYLKAFLTRHKIEFRKTHDLTELQRACAQVDPAFRLIIEPLKLLFVYAVDIRYPGISATEQDARDAVAAMKQVRAFVRARLGLQTR
ncbi:MAG: HEPN domain-containing protein [Anaerolineae bacterium]|nr:HEPN domain-containing protein [Anaerolineae bacterium]